MEPKIFFITGASGVGKTTLLQVLKEKYHTKKDWIFLTFDSIGVPTKEEMVEKYGSEEGWQKAKTLEWIDKMIGMRGAKTIIIEGQANPEFIIDGFKKYKFTNYQIVLVDCDDEVMMNRLIHDRKQPDLANQNMKNWLQFLRKQAQKHKLLIIDNAFLTKNQLLQKFEEILKNENLF